MNRSRIRINSVYLPMYDEKCRYLIFWGGRRSGKSWAISQLLVRRALESPPRKIIIMRKTFSSARYSVWPRIRSAIAEALPRDLYEINKSEHSIKIFNGGEIYCVGADDPEKLKSFEGVTDYWLEETTEFDEIDLDTIDAGLSTNGEWPDQIWMSFNPLPRIPGFQHWLERKFLNHTAIETSKISRYDRCAIVHTNYRDNAFCPEDTIKTLEAYRETNPTLYKMWVDGRFAEVEGAILTNWEIIDAIPDDLTFLGYGLDFGFANDPAALVACWAHRDALYVREELYSTNLTNSMLAERMREIGIGRSSIIRADSAEPKSIQDLRNYGFTVVPSAKGPDYKRFVAQWLQSRRKIYLEKNSKNLIQEIAAWCWERDKKGNILPRPADGNDHAIDAMIYCVWTGKPPVPAPRPYYHTAKTKSKVKGLPL